MQFSEVPNMSEPNLELLAKVVSLCYLFLYSHSESAQNPRNPRILLFCLFKYPRLFSNLTQCSRMFSKRNVLKILLFWPYIGVRN